MPDKIIIYTDGAALGNPGPGGFGVVMMFGPHRKELSQGFQLTTNNRMELLAVIVALSNIKDKTIPIEVYTDSQYVCNAIEKKWLFGWHKKGYAKIKNPDLWKQFYILYQQFNIRFIWVKGHAGIKENERCDVLATTAAKEKPTERDTFYEKSQNDVTLF